MSATIQMSLFDRLQYAKTWLAASLIDDVNEAMINAAKKSLDADKLSLENTSFLRHQHIAYLEGYYKSKCIHFSVIGERLCFDLPSYAMLDNLNKNKTFPIKDFETDPEFQKGRYVSERDGGLIFSIIKSRNDKLNEFIQDFEKDLVQRVKGRLLFNTEEERTFIYTFNDVMRIILNRHNTYEIISMLIRHLQDNKITAVMEMEPSTTLTVIIPK